MVAHVWGQHKPDTLMTLPRAVVWPWLACSGALISNNNRISWQVAYKQHSFILTWLVCHTLCRSLCLHLKLLCFCSHSCVICLFVTSFPSSFSLLAPAMEREKCNALKGAFCSCKICKSCLSLSAFFFWCKSLFFLLFCSSVTAWWLSHTCFSPANFRSRRESSKSKSKACGTERYCGIWWDTLKSRILNYSAVRLGDGRARSHYRKDRVRPSWIGLGREGLQGCWITSSWKSHMTGSHMLLSFVYTPHIAVQQQHVHTVKQTLTQAVWFFICVFV